VAARVGRSDLVGAGFVDASGEARVRKLRAIICERGGVGLVVASG
jgi:hypothetical protein